MANARMRGQLQKPVGASALSAFSGSDGLGVQALELGFETASGVGRWEPEVQSWTLRSGVKSGVERVPELHVGTGWKGRAPGAVPEQWVWVDSVWVTYRELSPGTGVRASRGPVHGLETALLKCRSACVFPLEDLWIQCFG